jgi:small subunit ribosomal protein S20
MPHIPVHPSAEKRHRQSLKRQARNRTIKTRVRTVTKHALETIDGANADAAQAALREAARVLQKAASKRTIKRNTVSRKIARLARRLNRAHPAAASAQPSSA